MITPETNKLDQPVVLVVDDDETVRMIAVEFLSQSGFQVHAVAHGAAALAGIDRINPDLILLDVEMADMDGFEVCQRLRRQPKHELTPIMMLTGLDNNESIDNAYEVGATDFVTKPINWSLLCHRLRYMYRASKISEQLAKSKSSLSAAQRIAKIGNWELDHSQDKMVWSEELYRILGVQPGMVEPTFDNLISFVHEKDSARVRHWLYLTDTAEERGSIDHLVTLADGTARYVRQEIEREFDSDGKLVHVQAIVQDFTERRRAERKIHQLAYFDTLTGLANRRLFQDKLDSAITTATNQSNSIALLFFDLDNFKKVNDTFGHAIGDQLLQEVSSRLTSSLGGQLQKSAVIPRDYTLARMSGDEFTLLIEDSSREEALSIASDIINTLSDSFSFEGHALSTSLSVGAAVFPEDADNAVALIKNADMAMYDAKRAGKNQAKMHDPKEVSTDLKQQQLASIVDDGLKHNTFENYYYPIVEASSGQVISLETVLMLDELDFDAISTDEFLPDLDKDHLISKLGEFVLRSACSDLKSYLESASSLKRVSIKIFAGQFIHANFIDSVSRAITAYELQAQQLELIISEAVLVNNMGLSLNTLQGLKKLGVQISIDGFGAGNCNLGQLKSLPIDSVKVDQTFINNVATSAEDAVAVRAVIAMGHAMGIRMTANGVEFHDQLSFLQEHGCDEVLGPIFSQPLGSVNLMNSLETLQDHIDDVLGINSDQQQLKSA